MTRKATRTLALAWLMSLLLITALGPGGRLSSAQRETEAGMEAEGLTGGISRSEIRERSERLTRLVLNERAGLVVRTGRLGRLWTASVDDARTGVERMALIWDAGDGRLISLTDPRGDSGETLVVDTTTEPDTPKTAMGPVEARRTGERWLATFGVTPPPLTDTRRIGEGSSILWCLEWSDGNRSCEASIDHRTGGLRFLRIGKGPHPRFAEAHLPLSPQTEERGVQ